MNQIRSQLHNENQESIFLKNYQNNYIIVLYCTCLKYLFPHIKWINFVQLIIMRLSNEGYYSPNFLKCRNHAFFPKSFLRALQFKKNSFKNSKPFKKTSFFRNNEISKVFKFLFR